MVGVGEAGGGVEEAGGERSKRELGEKEDLQRGQLEFLESHCKIQEAQKDFEQQGVQQRKGELES